VEVGRLRGMWPGPSNSPPTQPPCCTAFVGTGRVSAAASTASHSWGHPARLEVLGSARGGRGSGRKREHRRDARLAGLCRLCFRVPPAPHLPCKKRSQIALVGKRPQAAQRRVFRTFAYGSPWRSAAPAVPTTIRPSLIERRTAQFGRQIFLSSPSNLLIAGIGTNCISSRPFEVRDVMRQCP
jgi:hypothetical protein